MIGWNCSAYERLASLKLILCSLRIFAPLQAAHLSKGASMVKIIEVVESSTDPAAVEHRWFEIAARLSQEYDASYANTAKVLCAHSTLTRPHGAEQKEIAGHAVPAR